MKALIKFSGYIILKWTLFYIYQFIEGHTKWNFGKVNSEGFFLMAFMLLALPLIELTILFFPVQLVLRQRIWIRIVLLIAIFCLEFMIGWITTNQHFEIWMVIKLVLSTGLFWLMYRKQLIL